MIKRSRDVIGSYTLLVFCSADQCLNQTYSPQSNTSEFTESNHRFGAGLAAPPVLELRFVHSVCVMRVAILGAGDVGCAVGVALAQDEANEVVFIGRDSPTGRTLFEAATAGGAEVRHARSGWTARMPAEACSTAFTFDVTQITRADVIFVACKRTANAAVAPLIAKYAKRTATVIALQNGVGVRDELPNASPAIINFNIVRSLSEGRAVFLWTSRRTKTPPAFQLDQSLAGIAEVLDAAGLMAVTVKDVEQAAYGKLILNSGGNAINALSGVDIQTMLLSAGYRKLLKRTIAEVQEVYAAHHIKYDASGSVQYLKLMSLPVPFVWLAVRLLIDKSSRASMASDLNFGRPTEINFLNGHIVELGVAAGVPTPINERLCALVRAAEEAEVVPPSPLSPEQIADGLDCLVHGDMRDHAMWWATLAVAGLGMVLAIGAAWVHWQ